MVVSLESRAALALCQDDNSIQNLVELAEVEEPAVESKTLVPKSTKIGSLRKPSITEEDCGWRLGNPGGLGGVVGDRICEAGNTMDLTETVHGTDKTIGALVASDCSRESTRHANKSPGRVRSQEDIVQNDEPEESLGLADRPCLIAIGFVPAID